MYTNIFMYKFYISAIYDFSPSFLLSLSLTPSVQKFARDGRSLALCVCGWASDRDMAMSILPGQVIDVTEHGANWSRGRVWDELQVLCCRVLQCAAVCAAVCCVAVWCSVLQCIAVCCSVLQCVVVYKMCGSHSIRTLLCV